MRRNAALYRDTAIGAAALCAALLGFLTARWVAGGLAITAGVAWIVIERRRFPSGGVARFFGLGSPWFIPASRWFIQGLFLGLGVLMVWAFREQWLWITLAGVWSLVAAADLSRLHERFPVDSPVADQRALVNRRLSHLGALAAGTAVVAGLARLVSLELRLVAVALLAVFIVMVVTRTVRALGDEPPPPDEAETPDRPS